jgi:hypothetical protein
VPAPRKKEPGEFDAVANGYGPRVQHNERTGTSPAPFFPNVTDFTPSPLSLCDKRASPTGGHMHAILKLLIFLVLYMSAGALVEAGRQIYAHQPAPAAVAETSDGYVQHLCGMGLCARN